MPLTIAVRQRDRSVSDDFLLFPEAELRERESEERLAVDVFDGPGEIVIRAAAPGARAQDVDVTLHADMVTLRGRRAAQPAPEGSQPLALECAWGTFSRSVILPADVDADGVTASLEAGVLTVRLPKADRGRRIGVRDL